MFAIAQKLVYRPDMFLQQILYPGMLFNWLLLLNLLVTPVIIVKVFVHTPNGTYLICFLV
jgi:hypothetical protein